MKISNDRRLIANMDRKALFIVLEGIAAAVVLNLSGPFIQMFAKRLGAGDIHIALINSLPPLVAIFVLIPCSLLIDRVRDKRLVACSMILASSLFYLVIVLVPFIPHQMRAAVYVILIGLMNWPGSLYMTTWQSFFSDTFKGSHAAVIYSHRSKYGTFFGLVTVLLTGYILSALPGSEEGRIFFYQVFYVICFAISILQVLLLFSVKPGIDSQTAANGTGQCFRAEDFKKIFKNKPFMLFCLCSFTYHVAWQMGWPLFFIYNVDYAKANEFQLSVLNVAASLTSFLSFFLWNKLALKKGNSLIMIICTLGIAFNPFFYIRIMSFPEMIAANALVGIAGAGFSYSLFCSLLETLPEDKKTVYISVFNTLINISGFLAPLAGVWLYRYTSIFMAFFIIGILRVFASMLFIWRHAAEKKIMLKAGGERKLTVDR